MKTIHNLNESICELNYSFDYQNLIRFKNEDSLKAKYGEQFFNAFFQEFTESWCSILGGTLQYVDYLRLVEKSIIEASKKVDVTFTAPEDADAIYSEWSDYEELREVAIDIKEGADMVMVKPGLPYIDIIKEVKNNFKIPVLAYQVSGEYSLLSNAINNKILNNESVYEILVSFKRAGANAIITYYADYLDKIIK